MSLQKIWMFWGWKLAFVEKWHCELHESFISIVKKIQLRRWIYWTLLDIMYFDYRRLQIVKQKNPNLFYRKKQQMLTPKSYQIPRISEIMGTSWTKCNHNNISQSAVQKSVQNVLKMSKSAMVEIFNLGHHLAVCVLVFCTLVGFPGLFEKCRKVLWINWLVLRKVKPRVRFRFQFSFRYWIRQLRQCSHLAKTFSAMKMIKANAQRPIINIIGRRSCSIVNTWNVLSSVGLRSGDTRLPYFCWNSARDVKNWFKPLSIIALVAWSIFFNCRSERLR